MTEDREQRPSILSSVICSLSSDLDVTSMPHRSIEGRLVIATHNPGKLMEMRELLEPYGIEALSAGDLAVAWPDGHVEEFEGRVDGTLVWPPRGTKGFGYDPMFLPDGHVLTFGEMGSQEKHGLPPKGRGLSHRARAFLKLTEACLARR